MLHEKFPELEDKLAIGLVGDGSECFGYDDDISRDHDFEPGFCIFVSDDIDSRTEFQLERAYAKLPKTFEGVDRLKISPRRRQPPRSYKNRGLLSRENRLAHGL